MAPCITIQSQKLITWLIERNVVSKDYAKRLEDIDKLIVELNKAEPHKTGKVEEKPVQYFYSLDVLKYLEETDTSKDFFGRASSSIRSWRDVISRYESGHVNIAEISERLNDVCFQLLKCKSAITDRQKLLVDLQRKVQEFTTNQQSKDSELERSRKRFGIANEHVRLQLIEKAVTVPELLNSYVETLVCLQPALDFYASFVSYINSLKIDNVGPVCPTLRLLITSGHASVYHWKTGRPPASVGPSDDCLPKLLEQERKYIDNLMAEDEFTNEELDLGALEDATNLAEIDFGCDLEIDVIDFSAVEGQKDDTTAVAAINTGKSSTTAAASGANARLLLDSLEGRHALINDLEELLAFLLRVEENLTDFQAEGTDKHDTGKKKPNAAVVKLDSIAPIYHQMLQDAPAEISSISIQTLREMSSSVQRAFDSITDETVSHLCLLRVQPGYLERLIGSMVDLKRQADRARTRVMELTACTQQAEDDLTTFQNEVTSCLQERKQLVSFLETELSKIYERDIKLVGAAIST